MLRVNQVKLPAGHSGADIKAQAAGMLRIPAGEHTVRLVYETPLLRAGACISAVTAAALMAGIVVFDGRRRKKNMK